MFEVEDKFKNALRPVEICSNFNNYIFNSRCEVKILIQCFTIELCASIVFENFIFLGVLTVKFLILWNILKGYFYKKLVCDV